MKIYTFSLSNGFASGNRFQSTFADAVLSCVACSKSQNTRNWLHVKIDGKWHEIGHTFKNYSCSYRWDWDFVDTLHGFNPLSPEHLKYTVVADGIEYQFTSKKEADKFFVDAFLDGKSVYEIKK